MKLRDREIAELRAAREFDHGLLTAVISILWITWETRGWWM